MLLLSLYLCEQSSHDSVFKLGNLAHNEERNMHDPDEGLTLWLTGLSGAGKTTLAMALENYFQTANRRVERLDGDTVRQGLTRDLGFSKEDRDKNIERVTYVAKLLSRNGVIVILAFISPYREARNKARQETTNFIEVFVNAPLQTCIDRDTKGLYAKALRGEIPQFTGISDPYEEPLHPEIIVNTHLETPQASVQHILNYLIQHGFIAAPLEEAMG
jgi:adenylyl-sulfate kinase